MIKIENVEVVGLKHAIRGMRNPKNSWDRSDSYEYLMSGPTVKERHNINTIVGYDVGENDHDLMMRLATGGPVHAKYRRMIDVYLDITAPLYWWKEFDTYKVGTVANSCSTMHKIHAKKFELDDFSHEHLTDGSKRMLCDVIHILNYYREQFIKETNPYETPIMDKKDIWWQMIQLLPSSYNQRRTIKLNYEVLVGIYRDRRYHKLDEWPVLCNWIEELPYSEIITGNTAKTIEEIEQNPEWKDRMMKTFLNRR